MIENIRYSPTVINKHSRIDLILISNFLVNSVIGCQIGIIVLTDHAVVELHVDVDSGRYSGKKKYVNPLELPGFLHELVITFDLIFI